MRYTTWSRYIPGFADAVNLQGLLDSLGDFLLQSGFDGWDDGDGRSMDDLRAAILDALMSSGELTPEMLEFLNSGPSGDPEQDRRHQKDIADMIDRIIQRLMEEGYLRTEAPPQAPGGYQAMTGPGGQAREAARDVKFDLTDKAVDFLGYRALRHLLGSIGHASLGAHETTRQSTTIEAESASRPYEFGDVMNLDVPGTLARALAREGLRFPLPLQYGDLMVHQSDFRSSAATVLMLDCSHSMILYGEDRFTPAKKVALALTHLIRTQYPGDTLRVVLFHDSAEEIPLPALARAKVGPWHTNTAEGLRLARRILLGQAMDMRQIIMITDGKPSALTLPDGRIYVNSMGLDPTITRATFREVAECRRSGIMINTFMLARERSLVEFVKQVSTICRGKAYFTTTMTLGQFILMDFLKHKTRRVS